MSGPAHDEDAAMSVGAELADARERLGLSREDVSQRTKISVDRLLAIEQQDVANLPPLVYLKGFVREYATAVKLDPEETTSRYLSLLDDPAALTSAGADVPQTIRLDSLAGMESFPAEAPTGDSPLATTAPILELTYEPAARVTSPPEPPPGAHAIVTPPPQPVLKKVFLEDDDDLPPLEDKFAADVLLATDPQHVPEWAASAPLFAQMQPAPRTGFRGGFMAVALAVLAGILVAAYWEKLDLLYPRKAASTADARVKSPAPIRPDAAPASRASENPAESPARATNERPSGRPPATMPDAPAATPAPADRVATPATPAPATSPGAVPAAPPAAHAAPPAAATVPLPSPRDTIREAARSTGADLTGSWSWTTRIEVTDVAAFQNMNLGFRLQLKQDGDRITGRGLKWMENGRLIPERSRTPIILEGERRGNRLELRFTEHGADRRSSGTFVMDVGADGTLHGQFASTSANTSGSSIARRVSPEDR